MILYSSFLVTEKQLAYAAFYPLKKFSLPICSEPENAH
jgi:hypothetical protein